MTSDPAPYQVTSGYAATHPDTGVRFGEAIRPAMDRLGISYRYNPRPNKEQP